MITQNKRGAMELSMSTIVILVLAMSMLILGLVLIKTIFSGAKYNVDTMNTKVQNEINKLFVEDKKIVVYLAGGEAKVNKGDSYGVAFGLKNLITGTPDASKFTYDVSVANPTEVKSNCGINEKEALSWIKTGVSGTFQILPGETVANTATIIKFQIPQTAPLCIIRYNINVKANGEFYTADSFDINIAA